MLEFLPDILVVLSLVLIALGRLKPFTVNRAGLAFAAASAILLERFGRSGLEGVEELFAYIDGSTLILLVCMMLLVGNLAQSGFFALIAARVRSLSLHPRQLLFGLMLFGALVSAFFMNDTAVLCLSPLVIKLCQEKSFDPKPQLLGLALSANLGSALTLLGNPQNIFIAGISGLNFAKYLGLMLVPVLVSLGFAYGYLRLFYRKSLVSSPPMDKKILKESGTSQVLPNLQTPNTPAASIAFIELSQKGANTKSRPFVYKPLMYKSLVCLLLFFLLSLLGLPLVLGALLASSLLLLTRRVAVIKIFTQVDWTLAVFFSGLFIISAAARQSLSFAALETQMMPLFKAGLALQTLVISLFSQLVSNVPAVMVLSPFLVQSGAQEFSWVLMAGASTFAGNLTLLGSVANLIVAEYAQAKGINLGFLDFLKGALPVALFSLLVLVFWLGLVYQSPLL